MGKSLDRRVSPEFVFRIIGLGLFIYLFFQNDILEGVQLTELK